MGNRLIVGGKGTPADISPLFWHDAGSPDFITNISGFASELIDRANPPENFSQGTADSRPATGSRVLGNNRNVLDFDGSDDFMSRSSVGLSTKVLFVGLWDIDTGGTCPLISSSGGGGSQAWILENNNFILQFDANIVYGTTYVGAHIFAFEYDFSVTTIEVFVDGLSEGSNSSLSAEIGDFTWRLMTNFVNSTKCDGAFAEMICVNNPQSWHREFLEGYLNARWRLSVLSASHKYSSYWPPPPSPYPQNNNRFSVGSLWTPKDAEALVYLDATKRPTIKGPVSAVTAWNDLSGNGNDFSKAGSTDLTTESRLINGRNTVSHESGGTGQGHMDSPSLSVPADHMVFMCCHIVSAIFSQGPFQLTSGTNRYGMYRAFEEIRTNGTNPGPDLTGLGDSTGVDLLVSVVFDGSGGIKTMYKDGVSVGSNAYTSVDGTVFEIFKNVDQSCNMDIGCFVVIPYVHEETRLRMEGWMARTFKLQANLPGTHPYKSGAYLKSGGGFNKFTVNRKWDAYQITTHAWYDASDISTIDDTNGAVDLWRDKKGNGRNISETGANRPTTALRLQNNLNVIDFDTANNQHLEYIMPASDSIVVSTLDIYALCKKDVLTALYLGTLDGDANAQVRMNRFADYSWEIRNDSGNLEVITDTNGDTDVHLINYRYDGVEMTIFVDGVETVTPTAQTGNVTIDNFIRIAGNAFGTETFDGFIGEWIWADFQSDENRQKMEGSICHKWGIEANLPAGHPYLNYPPLV